MRRLSVVSSALLVALALSACGNGEPRDELTLKVEDELRPDEVAGHSTLDFDDVIDGEWTRLGLVCGASDATIADALGFEWEQPEQSGVRAGFAYVFATDSDVERYFGPMTAAPFDDRVYVSPCAWSEDDPVTLILFERRDAVIQFELRDTPGYASPRAWFPVVGDGAVFYGSRWE